MNKLAINLWFDSQAEEAANFYTSIFKDSKITNTTHYGNAGQEVTKQKPGTVMTVDFEINGLKVVALNGGPFFKFNEAISIVIYCDTQEEIDEYWEKMSVVPESEQCGWLKDKFGVSWQVVPTQMDAMMNSEDTAANERVMTAMLKMKKLVIADLEAARDAQ
jgi:predicted 3-demethylubiquinone-9 3-methyltransferase (glyoxalase superfamily)